MTENEKLRALLAEARGYVLECFDECASADTLQMLCRIEAALAEPREDFVAIAAPAVRDELIQVLDNYSTLHRERDEARAEVERLKQEVRIAKHTVDMRTVKQQMKRNQEAFKRGAEAMREKAAHTAERFQNHLPLHIAPSIRALPLPEEKP
jgi:hypothetical protein